LMGKLDEKTMTAVRDALSEWFQNGDGQLDKITALVDKHVAAAQPPELPPKPEWVVLRDYRGSIHCGTFALTGEYRVPTGNDMWAYQTFDKALHVCADGKPDTSFHSGNRWILTRRPAAPPSGYEWDEARGWDRPQIGDFYLNEKRNAEKRFVPSHVWDTMTPVKRWILKPAAPKGAFEKWNEEYKVKEAGQREHCVYCAERAWLAAVAACAEYLEFRGLLASSNALRTADHLKAGA
jgi:hypothetical protein